VADAQGEERRGGEARPRTTRRGEVVVVYFVLSGFQVDNEIVAVMTWPYVGPNAGLIERQGLCEGVIGRCADGHHGVSYT
jgi:hypothetical protein